MSQAYKCNRCKKCYAPEDAPDGNYFFIENAYLVNGKEYEKDPMLGHRTVEHYNQLSFCKDCSRKIIMDILNYKPEEDAENEKAENSVHADTDGDINLLDIFGRIFGIDSIRKFTNGETGRAGETSERKSETFEKGEH